VLLTWSSVLAALVAAMLVISHLLADLVTSRIALWRDRPRVGLGVYNHHVLDLCVEGLVILGGGGCIEACYLISAGRIGPSLRCSSFCLDFSFCSTARSAWPHDRFCVDLFLGLRSQENSILRLAPSPSPQFQHLAPSPQHLAPISFCQICQVHAILRESIREMKSEEISGCR
jgi:hypothetical protein